MGYFLVSVAVMAAGMIIGVSLISGAKIVATAIYEKNFPGLEKAISDSSFKMRPPSLPPVKTLQPGEKKVEGVGPGTNAVKGDKKAKVLLVEFSDFQCPFSKRFYKDIFPQIEKNYIETGKVQFAYRDYPLSFHPFAIPAAIAARCAGKQNKYWGMFNKLTEAASLDDKSLNQCARDIKLDLVQLDACLSDKTIKEDIGKDFKEANRFGVSGTPAFFINGRFIEGMSSYEVFQKIIDEELAKTNAGVVAVAKPKGQETKNQNK